MYQEFWRSFENGKLWINWSQKTSYLARTGYHSHHLATIFAENGLDYDIFLSLQRHELICFN